MRFARPAVLVVTVLATVVATAGPAAAVPPANDTYPGRVTIGALPFTTTQDTSEATTDADDAELNVTTCGAPAMDASVWYQVTATTDSTLVADVSGSDYSAGVFVATGSPGSFGVVACAPGATAWSAVAGETYNVVVIDDQLDGAGNGGTMQLTVDQAPPAPTIDVTVNPTGGFDSKTGEAIVTGTVTCTGVADFAGLDVEVNQRVGRGSVLGFGGADVTCDGVSHPFSIRVAPFNGKFAGGKAATVTLAFACGDFVCGIDFEERVIMLRGRA
jgi:hypothetical protein